MKKISLVLLLSASSAFASGGASDLIAPAINIIILASFLIWKLKTPMSNMFKTKAQDIKDTLERAEIKAKEAEMMMDVQKKKLANLDNEINQINLDSDQEISQFEKNYSNETDEKSEKLKLDASAKIEAEKRALMNKLNTLLIDEVVAKTKSKLKSDSSLSEKATQNILQGLQ